MEDYLTSLDRCDACGAQAYVRAVLISGELLFCGHHWNANKETLTRMSLRIESDLEKLYPTVPESSQEVSEVVE
jgi:recombinational DNA repair protein (RecF pathway)